MESDGVKPLKGRTIINGYHFDVQFTRFELECIDHLRKLIKTYPLLLIRMDDNFLARFLNWSNWNVDKAFEKLLTFYTFRKENAKYTPFGPLSDYENFIKSNCLVMLDQRDRNGRRVYICRIARYLMARSIYEVSHLDDMWFEVVLDEPETQKNGVSVIMDVKGMPLSLLKWLTPKHSSVMTRKADVAPLAIYYHVVNSSGLMKVIMPVIFQFMSPETRERVFFHYDNWPSLHKFIEPEKLPSEYGGTRELNYENLRRLLYDREDFLLEYMTHGFVDPEPDNWNHQLDQLCDSR
ncbi:CRAL-TRIO domain-containing protein [Sergentomyia squamirostris]